MPLPAIIAGASALLSSPAGQKALAAAVPGLLEGGVGLYQGFQQNRRAKANEQSAREAFESSRAAYFAQDISNPYANMENPYEDLTVNQQQAKFQAEQQQQALANTMQSMRGAAGGSGIAAFTQALANQQAQNLQQASASIGMQESRIQQLRAGEASRLQQYERQGEVYSRELKADLLGTQLGLDIKDLSAAQEQLIASREGIASAVGSIGSGILGGVDAYTDRMDFEEARAYERSLNEKKNQSDYESNPNNAFG